MFYWSAACFPSCSHAGRMNCRVLYSMSLRRPEASRNVEIVLTGVALKPESSRPAGGQAPRLDGPLSSPLQPRRAFLEFLPRQRTS